MIKKASSPLIVPGVEADEPGCLPACWLGAAAGLAPGRENPVDSGPHLVAGGVTGHTGHEQCVVTGVLVADRGGHGQGDGVFV